MSVRTCSSSAEQCAATTDDTQNRLGVNSLVESAVLLHQIVIADAEGLDDRQRPQPERHGVNRVGERVDVGVEERMGDVDAPLLNQSDLRTPVTGVGLGH
jgi:hypothetical protein